MIYDTFMFFNELELLELRLNELNGVVDKFVLVEATRTFTNKPKPLYYAENKQRFSQFNDKIIHIIVDDSPDSDNPWVLDRYQKNCVGRGLRNAAPDDIVVFSDADEIRYSGYKKIPDGGWHFTWMGGVERIRTKLQSFPHSEFNKPEYLDEKNILNALQNHQSLLDTRTKLQLVPLDNRFPDYILKHPERFPGWILPVK